MSKAFLFTMVAYKQMRFALMIFLSLVVLAPWIFELITFAIFLSRSQIFYLFSAARLPFAIGIEVYFGYKISKIVGKKIGRYGLAGIILTFVLVLLLYQVCDERDCYYTGPDQLGEARLFAILSSALLSGMLAGDLAAEYTAFRKKLVSTETSKNMSYFVFAIPIFLGSFLASIVYEVPTEPLVGIVVYFSYVTAPFLIAGAISSFCLNIGLGKVAMICALAQVTLFALFGITSLAAQPDTVTRVVIVLGLSVTSSVVSGIIGYKITKVIRKGSVYVRSDSEGNPLRQEKTLGVIFLLLFVTFGLSFVHPFVPAVVDMHPSSEASGENLSYSPIVLLSSPLYYSGAYNTDHYFASDRIEVTITMHAGTPVQSASADNFIMAGIGAQSPNCCKDGLDYGYRADLLEKNGKAYLVARAWETCDQNMACSGFPWHSIMHSSEEPIALDSSSPISIAMAWTKDEEKSVHWYYHSNETQSWTEFSSFVVPRIENPGFNLGVIWVANPFTNFPSNNANFFQEGVSTQTSALPASTSVVFECPAYFADGVKHCFPQMAPIQGFDSHWKVWWQWGLPHSSSIVGINNPRTIVSVS